MLFNPNQDDTSPTLNEAFQFFSIRMVDFVSACLYVVDDLNITQLPCSIITIDT